MFDTASLRGLDKVADMNGTFSYILCETLVCWRASPALVVTLLYKK